MASFCGYMKTLYVAQKLAVKVRGRRLRQERFTVLVPPVRCKLSEGLKVFRSFAFNFWSRRRADAAAEAIRRLVGGLPRHVEPHFKSLNSHR